MIARFRLGEEAFSRVEWLTESFQLDVNMMLFASKSNAKDASIDVDLVLRDFSGKVPALQALYPQNVYLQAEPLQWIEGILSLIAAQREPSTSDKRMQLLERATMVLDKNAERLRGLLEKHPDSATFANRLSVVLRHMADAETLKGNLTKVLPLSVESARAERAMYERQANANPNDASWQSLLADDLYGEVVMWGHSGDFAQAKEPLDRAIALYEQAMKAEPDNHFWISKAADAIDTRKGCDYGIAYKSGAADKPELVSSQLDADARGLALWQKCCELTSGRVRAGYAKQLDKQYGKILPQLRREELLSIASGQPPGPYVRKYVSVSSFNYLRSQDRERFWTDEIQTSTPFEPRERTLIGVLPGIQTDARLRSLNLQQQELYAQTATFNFINYDEDLIENGIPRILKIKEALDLNDPTVQRELAWTVRSLNASLRTMHELGENGHWYQWLSHHLHAESEPLKSPPRPWNPMFDLDNPEWERMDYAATAREAQQLGRLDTWFTFMNDECRDAATVVRSPEAKATWAEDILFRQIVDGLVIDSELASPLLTATKAQLDAKVELEPRLRLALATVAFLRGNKELASELDKSVSDDTVALIRLRLVRNSMAKRQFAAIVPLMKEWNVQAQGYYSPYIASCLSVLGEYDESNVFLDEWIAKYPMAPALVGFKRLILLDQYRDSADLKEKLGPIAPVNPDEDINTAIVVAYLNVLDKKTPDVVEEFVKVTNHPMVDMRSWTNELVGDAWVIAQHPDKARASYEAALKEFSPATDPQDRELLRVKGKLAVK